jgi:prepilin-type N-terminal cleavage/methylation domain-containing protein
MPIIQETWIRHRINGREWRRNSGFSLLELTMTLAVGLILAAMAVPAVRSSIQYFRVRSAVSSITGAIQSTRYRAIFDGCHNIAFNSTANTFQVASETAVAGSPCTTTFRRNRLCRRRAAGAPCYINRDLRWAWQLKNGSWTGARPIGRATTRDAAGAQLQMRGSLGEERKNAGALR